MAYQLGLKVDHGAYVIAASPGAPADQAGVKAGDVIVSVDGHDVTSAEDLGTILNDLQPGKTVSVVVDRDGQEQTFDVTLAARPLPTQLP